MSMIDKIKDFLNELQQLGCTLPPSTCRELLAMDVELNAQGLELWWDKNNR